VRQNNKAIRNEGVIGVSNGSKICPSCGEGNNPMFTVCWKCNQLLLTEKNKQTHDEPIREIFIPSQPLRSPFSGLVKFILLLLIGLAIYQFYIVPRYYVPHLNAAMDIFNKLGAKS